MKDPQLAHKQEALRAGARADRHVAIPREEARLRRGGPLIQDTMSPSFRTSVESSSILLGRSESIVRCTCSARDGTGSGLAHAGLDTCQTAAGARRSWIHCSELLPCLECSCRVSLKNQHGHVEHDV